MKKYSFLTVMSVISFLFGLISIISFVGAVLMNVVASFADKFFSLLMPFSPQVIGHYFMFFLCMLVGGVMMLILSISGMKLVYRDGDYTRSMMFAAMTALIHVGMMYSSAPNQVMYISTTLFGTLIPVLFILSAALYLKQTGRNYS